MLSSSSIELDSFIPAEVLEIFDHPGPEDWFVVFYITRDRKIITKQTFLFKGRDISYQKKCVSEADGIFREVFIIYRARTARYSPQKGYSLREVELGQQFYMTIKGDIIP